MTRWDKLTYTRSETGEVVVYRMAGILTNSPESYAFLETLRDEVHEGRIRFVLEMTKVEMITSAGVGILAACYTTVTNAGGRLGLAAINERSRLILNVVRLLDLIPASPTEEEAIRAASA